MIQQTHSVTIGKPVGEVFAYVVEQENNPQWQEGVVAAALVDRPPRVGGKMSETRNFLGREMISEAEITAYEENRRFAFKSIGGPVAFEAEMTFVEAGGETTLTTEIQAEVGGFFKLAEGAVAKQLEQSFGADGLRLKELLEAS